MFDPGPYLGMDVDDPGFLVLLKQHRQQVETLKTPTNIYYLFKPFGVALLVDYATTRVTSVFYYSGPSDQGDTGDGYTRYPAALPQGLTFEMGREGVISRLGPPTAASEEEPDPHLGKISAYVRYDRAGRTLHVRFHGRSGTIRIVSEFFTEDFPVAG